MTQSVGQGGLSLTNLRRKLSSLHIQWVNVCPPSLSSLRSFSSTFTEFYLCLSRLVLRGGACFVVNIALLSSLYLRVL